MREYSFFFFLTFVLIISGPQSLAAPQENSVPPIIQEPIQNVEDPALTAAAIHGSQNTQYAIQVSLALLGGQVTKKLDSGTQTGYGLVYSIRENEEEFWDIQAHWLTSRAAWVQLGKKFLITHYEIPYEPYYRLALSHVADPDDALAGISRIDSFKGTAAIGFMDLADMGEILTLEMGLHFGSSGLAYHIQSGLQWTF